ncbi:MAG: hypothetical protein LBG62_03000 [Candidatus Methanoplasma sp.]|jgi:hypothetical protein|nr:hypothetical protein [Candidatus Methanoplasma sp.]
MNGYKERGGALAPALLAAATLAIALSLSAAHVSAHHGRGEEQIPVPGESRAVAFDSRGGSEVPAQAVPDGCVAAEPDPPT